MHEWGWRLPFLVAAPLGLAGLYLRSHIEDTPVFREVEAAGDREPGHLFELSDLFRHYWRPLLVLGALVIALNVVNYTLLSYMPTYLQVRLGLSTEEALYVPIIGMLCMMLFVPAAGALSDKLRSEEHTSELQSLMRNSYAVFCLKTKNQLTIQNYL